MIELALANAFIVITLSRTSLFKKFRDILPNTPVINIRKLFHCPYCLTPWVSFLLLLPSFLIIKIFALSALSSGFAFILLLYLKELE